MLTQREKAIRAAAIVDTDGAIMITTTYSISSSVTSVDMVLLNWLQDNYKGSINKSGGRSSSQDHYIRRIRYQWKVDSRMCEAFLREIEPFLLLKRQQAQACLELRQWQGRHLSKVPAEIKQTIWSPYRAWVQGLNSNKLTLEGL